MARFFTSDLHLGHRNIARYEPARAIAAGVPPLDEPADAATQDLLDADLIRRWNAVVQPSDEVWVLGDLCLGKIDRSLGLVGELAGRIVLVPGNHDRVWAGEAQRDRWWDRYLQAGIAEIVDGPTELELSDGTMVDADHFPYVGDSRDEERFSSRRPIDRGRVLLHGHVHSRWQVEGRMVNVGVDAWDLAPVAEDRIVALQAQIDRSWMPDGA